MTSPSTASANDCPRQATEPGDGNRPAATRRRSLALATAVLATAFALPCAMASGEGWFGLELAVEADGFWRNPTVRTVKVTGVVPGSPAAKAGIVAGDAILQIQGTVVAGAESAVLRVAMRKNIGQTLRLQVKHGLQEPDEVKMVAARTPPK